jgi:hypothetical protein
MADEELNHFAKIKEIIAKAKLDYRKLYSDGLPYLDIYRAIPNG